jgi:hypothetical protein
VTLLELLHALIDLVQWSSEANRAQAHAAVDAEAPAPAPQADDKEGM